MRDSSNNHHSFVNPKSSQKLCEKKKYLYRVCNQINVCRAPKMKNSDLKLSKNDQNSNKTKF